MRTQGWWWREEEITSMTQSTDWMRKIIRHVPFVMATVGTIIVFGGGALFYVESPAARVGSISMGVLLFLGGFFIASNPFFKNQRRYTALRGQLTDFIGLVRQLNKAAGGRTIPEQFHRIKSEMHASVERIAMLAGEEDE